MKAFITGLLIVLILGITGYFTFKATIDYLINLNSSPAASSSPLSSGSISPSAKPSKSPVLEESPDPNYIPTTKGGLPVTTGKVKGVSITKKPLNTPSPSPKTPERYIYTIVKSNACPNSTVTEIKDITGPLTFKYELKNGYSFGITVWKKDGNEIIQNTVYSGDSGMIKTIVGVDYLKVRIETKTCSSTSENWLNVTAER